MLASMPAGWGMGGLVSSSPVRPQDITAIPEDLKSIRSLRLRILPNPLRGAEWSTGVSNDAIVVPRFSHILNLDGGFEAVEKNRFRQTARRNARKALRAELEVERDTTGRLIPVYRDLFARSIDRWAARSNEPLWLARRRGNLEDPTGKLEYLAATLGEQMVTRVAWHKGEPAAATILLAGNSHFYWRGAMHEELGPATYAAYILQKASIEEACHSGANDYYFGESGQSGGLANFKERFGAVGFSYPEIRLERIPLTKANDVLRANVKKLVGYRQA
jgi:hypothetical protein